MIVTSTRTNMKQSQRLLAKSDRNSWSMLVSKGRFMSRFLVGPIFLVISSSRCTTLGRLVCAEKIILVVGFFRVSRSSLASVASY